MGDTNVGHEHVVIERDSGAGMGVVLGVVLAIVLAIALMWIVFGANTFGAAGGPIMSNPNKGTDVNVTVPQPEIKITVPNQQPAAPAQPSKP